jgi:hypothetical protein
VQMFDLDTLSESRFLESAIRKKALGQPVCVSAA